MAAQIYLWPNPDLEGVVDEAGDPFPVDGAFVTWNDFYRNAVSAGELLTEGPAESGGIIPGSSGSSAVTNDSTHGPLLPTALTAATVTDALDNAWANSPEFCRPIYIRPNVNIASTLSGGPFAVQNTTGSVTVSGTIDSASYLRYRARQTARTTAVAGNVAGVWATAISSNIGSIFLELGLRVTYRFGYETLTAAMRSFAGLKFSLAPTNIDPAAQNIIIGVGAPLGSGNLHLYNRGTSGGFDLDLGSAFPISSQATYEVTLVAPTPAAFTGVVNGVYYRVRRLDVKGAVATGLLNTDIATGLGGNALGFSYWCSNNTDAAICALSLLGVEGALGF